MIHFKSSLNPYLHSGKYMVNIRYIKEFIQVIYKLPELLVTAGVLVFPNFRF